MRIKRGFYCAVNSCTSKPNGIVSFFYFPRDQSRCSEWIRACNRPELNGKDEKYMKQTRVCAKHFEDKMFLNDLKNRLQPHAKPTLFLTTNNAVDAPTESTIKDSSCNPTITEVTSITESLLSPSISIQTDQRLSCNTPRKRKFKDGIILLKKENKRLKTTRENHLENITVDDFKELCGKFLPPSSAKFVKSQVSLNIARSTDKRYSDEFKKFSLQLYFISPKIYKYVSKNFMLPTVRSLQRFIHGMNFQPGFLNYVFDVLKLKVSRMTENEKYCTLCWNEMAIKTNLFYNCSQDKIIGLIDNGKVTEFIPTQKVLVLMVKGLLSNWKQPLAFFFYKSPCHETNQILNQCLYELFKISLCVKVVINDQGSNFLETINSLGVTIDKPYFEFLYENDFKKIYFMYDPPHLIKSVRNTLLNSNKIEYLGEKRAYWEFIDQFYKLDKTKSLRIASKLTDKHLSPNNVERMRISLAAEVLSESVAVGVSTYVDLNKLPAYAAGTAEFIERFDRLFNLFNSSKYKAKQYNLPYNGAQFQTDFLKEMLDLLKSIKVINRKNKDVTNSIKCFKSWSININALKMLWNEFQAVSVKFLLTKKLNQDCLENFFDAVRAKDGNHNPTAFHFICTFKNLFSLNFMQCSEKSNCEDDFQRLLNSAETSPATSLSDQPEKSIEIYLPKEDDYKKSDLPHQNALHYISGYLIKKCLEKHTCPKCLEYSKAVQILDGSTIMWLLKTFETKNKSTLGNLRMPGLNFVSFISKMDNCFLENFASLALMDNVGLHLIKLFEKISFSSPCKDFPRLYLMKLFCKLKILYTLKKCNRQFKRSSRKSKKFITVCSL